MNTYKEPSGGLIHYKYWDVPNPKAIIILFHGIGEHLNRYNHVASFFNGKGISFRGFDWPGHGKSEGALGFVRDYNHLMDVPDPIIEKTITDFPNTPVFLYGHSMGGNIALTYLLRKPNTISGVIASEPWIQLAFKPNKLTIMAGKVVGKFMPSFTQPSGLDVKHISRDPAVVEAYVQDPLVHDKVSAGLGLTLLKTADWLDTFTGEIPAPILLLHSQGDLITSASASRAFAERVTGPITFHSWEDLYHEIHNEPQQEEVFSIMDNWLQKQL